MISSHEKTRKEILANFLREVWSGGRIEACDTYLAQNYAIRHDPGDPWDGKTLTIAAFKERVRLSRAPFADQQFHVQEMFADGEAVVATWLWSATHTGDLPDYPATGLPLTMSGATVYFSTGTTGSRPLAGRRSSRGVSTVAAGPILTVRLCADACWKNRHEWMISGRRHLVGRAK